MYTTTHCFCSIGLERCKKAKGCIFVVDTHAPHRLHILPAPPWPRRCSASSAPASRRKYSSCTARRVQSVADIDNEWSGMLACQPQHHDTEAHTSTRTWSSPHLAHACHRLVVEIEVIRLRVYVALRPCLCQRCLYACSDEYRCL